MWGVLLKCYVWNRRFEEAIQLYYKMLDNGIHINRFIFPSILRACSGFGDLGSCGKLHGRIIKCGFDNDPVVETSLLCMYGAMGRFDIAQKVFDAMPIKDVVSWSSMVELYVENGEANEGLETFRLMVCEGVNPDSVSMLSVAEACGDLGSLRLAKSVHGHALRRTMQSDGSLDNSLVVMYAKCGDLRSAERIFQGITYQRTVSWTAMISCYNQTSCFRKALEVFVDMQDSKVEPNSVTMMSILSTCARLGLLNEGKSIFCFAIRKDIDPNLDLLGPGLLDLYAECGKLDNCGKVLLATGEHNIVSWNMLIGTYARKGFMKEALGLFTQMQAKGLMPDSFSLASSLSACGNMTLIELGHQIHCHIIKRSYFDEFVQNSLMDMYSKCGYVDSAYIIFDNLKQRSVVAWNCMICGFSQNGYSVEAISLFDQMYLDCLELNEVTFLSVIQACSQIGYLEKGKWAHHKLITYGMKKDIYIDTALLDMYAKCGDLQTAQGVFNSMLERSVVSWSAMIAGYGMHGKINAAISLFNQMLESGVKPNDITFMNILSACSHAGSVKEGRFYFSLMKDFGIEPNTEHFSCIVDLLSRAGDLDGAYEIIKSMSLPVDASIWGALLNGYRIHRRLDKLENIQRDILNISTEDTGYYTLLSNIYAEGGNWDKFGKVRLKMKGIGLKKVPGYSTIELNKQTYRFGAGDHSLDPQVKEIYSFLENLHSLAQEQNCNMECVLSLSDNCVSSSDGNDVLKQFEAACT